LNTTVKKPGTLFEFLIELYPDSPRTRIKKILQSGNVRVNNLSVTLNSYALKPGDAIEIINHASKTSKGGLPFPVLFEDEHVIVIDKPAGISTSSTDGSKNVQDTLSEFLKVISKGKERSFVVHRLDKEVSGVVLFAKEKQLMEKLRDHWDETEKHYYALVEGTPPEEEGAIKSWLLEDNRQKVHSVDETENAKFAITSYKFIKKVGEYTLLDIRTLTGRKNQIRVHLADIGCPIVGDRKYGASAEFERRVRLHAYLLSFPHPVTGKTIEIRSAMPTGFLKVEDADEKYK